MPADNQAGGGQSAALPGDLRELLEKSRALQEEGLTSDLIALADEMVLWFGSDDNPEMQAALARVLFVKSSVPEAGDPEQGLAALDEVVRRYAANPERRARLYAIRAQYKKILLSLRAGRSSEAVDATDRLVESFSTEEDAGLQAESADLLVKASWILSDRGEPDVAVRASRAISERLRDAEHPVLQKFRVLAEIMVGGALARLGRFDDAVAAGESIVEMGKPALEALSWLAQRADRLNYPLDRERTAWAMFARAGCWGD